MALGLLCATLAAALAAGVRRTLRGVHLEPDVIVRQPEQHHSEPQRRSVE